MDISVLNRFTQCSKFRILMVNQIRLTLYQGAWLVTQDLSDAYWHVNIAKRYQKFLAAQVRNVTFVSTRLLFGLNIALRAFTKTEQGISILFYLDNWLIVSSFRGLCIEHVWRVAEHATLLGFQINW